MDGNFGRKIKVTFIPNSWNQKKGVSEPNIENSVVISYNIKDNKDLCSRIDFHIHSLGPGFLKTERCSQQVAQIDIWNIGSELNQMFDAYNNPNKSSDWNPFEIKQWSLNLEIGYENGDFQNVFTGTISSFYFERVQNENNVDNIFHFICWYPILDKETLQDKKATSGTDYLAIANRTEIVNMQSKKITLENYIKKIIIDRPRAVLYVKEVETYIKKTASFLNRTISTFTDTFTAMNGDAKPLRKDIIKGTKIVKLGYSDDLTADPPVEKLDRYFQIQYDSSQTAYFFKTTTIFNQPVENSKNYERTLEVFVRKFGYKLAKSEYKETGIIIFKIYKNSDVIVSKSKKWEIVNFQNLIKSPEISMNNMNLTILLEPNVDPYDTVVLKVTDDFMSLNRPSFSANISPSAITQFAGANSMGIAEFTEKEKNIEDQKSYGNIFNKIYNIISVDHQGSSHEALWQTKLECVAVTGA